MTDQPLVSVVTVYYNRVGHVREAMQSLFDQTEKNIEIIAADDGSTDGTGAALEALDDPRLIVRRHENMGFVAAVNAAIRSSRGKYVAIHGSGDISQPQRLAKQAAILEARPEIGLVGCWIENEDLVGQALELKKPTDDMPLREEILKRNPFTHGEVMYRRDLFDKVGGYREFFRFAQDRDLWVRMSRHTDHAVVPEVLYRRKRLAGGVSTTAEKLILQGMLSEFAVHCGREVAAGRPDPLERTGPSAGLLRTRSASLAGRFARVGIKMLAIEETQNAEKLIAAARNEHPNLPIVRVASALLSASRMGAVWSRVLRPSVRRGLELRTGPIGG
ncbi:glycosyltransferase family 2 protein [Pontivivens ytuae]|uniref:Glycosyltransferase n=1 Tax=Pontivivens ytuae TaxID=2789856 RepID=A0A7S9LNK4_9RHOB|nr:glycosyltransferase [Pontivivens ytuae]QPH52211.1 glycosyltransferase [Pontivivens ytuae]